MDFNPNDSRYLDNELCNRMKKIVVDKHILLNNKQFVGVIKLPSGKVLRLKPKTDVKLIDMISYVNSFPFFDSGRFFHIDPKVLVEVEEGRLFFEPLVEVFLLEFQKIMRRGFYKSYQKIEGETKYLKGKLLIRKQISKTTPTPTFYCRYHELTLNNTENQIILYAANQLMKLAHPSNKFKSKLLFFISMLSDFVDMRSKIGISEVENVQTNRLNDYYENIIALSKAIITGIFCESVLYGKAKACNFLLDMNLLFEKFVYLMVKNILENDERFKGYYAEEQKKYKNLFVEERIRLKPDIIIKKRTEDGNDIAVLVLDTKYKNIENGKLPSNEDYYQMVSYSLALNMLQPEDKVNCALIALGDKPVESTFTIDFDRLLPEKNIGAVKIHTSGINLDIKDSEFVGGVKLQVAKILDSIFPR